MSEAIASDYWNSRAREHWLLEQDRLDELFAPLSEAAIRQAQPSLDEHVLDVGCGCGATVIDIARRVGAAGKVMGLDISAQVLGRAEERIKVEGLAQQVILTLADAQTYAFVPSSVDLIFSRLGVMFFADPVAAFSNLRRALRPSGRMVFICPRTRVENRYISTAVDAAGAVLPPGKIQATRPDQPGMFSFADPQRVGPILECAGFHEIRFVRHDQPMRLGGPGEAAEAASFSTKFGPLSHVRADAEPELLQSILDAVTNVYRKLEGPEGIVLDGAFWIVTAHP